jgi:hypothetical protein
VPNVAQRPSANCTVASQRSGQRQASTRQLALSWLLRWLLKTSEANKNQPREQPNRKQHCCNVVLPIQILVLQPPTQPQQRKVLQLFIFIQLYTAQD